VASAAPQPNILLITIDTWRADHSELIGQTGSSARTPNLVKLAAQGVYAPAYVQLPQTNPNHTTILTGTYVQTHGLRIHLQDKLKPGVPMLSELLKQHGYRTAAAVSWFSFEHELSGLGRGWDTFDDYTVYANTFDRVQPGQAVAMYTPGVGTTVDLDGRAQVTVDGVLKWLDDVGTQPDKPWFLWVHFQDPHYPYTAPAPYGALPNNGSSFDGSANNVGKVAQGYQMTPQDRERLLAAYDGEISYTDVQVGRIFDRLDQRGLTSRTIAVVTADHGECFQEHNDWLHGASVYEADVKVPLIIRYPGDPSVLVPNRPLPATIQSADITPTLLEMVGLLPLPTMEGRSFAPLLAGRDDSGPARAAWGFVADNARSYVVSGEWKLIRRHDGSGPDELYHLPDDPGEANNLRGDGAPEMTDQMTALLEGWLAAKNAGKTWQPWLT
jgi:arylsulfatase A-like enzyme